MRVKVREEVGYRDTIAFENVNVKVRLILNNFLPTPQHEIVKPTSKPIAVARYSPSESHLKCPSFRNWARNTLNLAICIVYHLHVLLLLLIYYFFPSLNSHLRYSHQRTDYRGLAKGLGEEIRSSNAMNQQIHINISPVQRVLGQNLRLQFRGERLQPAEER